MTKALEQAIIGYWGERCADFDAGCPCCKAWAELDALEGGVADVLWRKIDRLLSDAYAAGMNGDDFDMLAARSALSAPAQRVEEGLELEIGDGALTWRGDGYSINVTADEAVLCVRGVGAQIVAVGDDLLNAVHDASPAPAPHAEVDADVPDYDAGLLNDFGGGDVSWWQDYLRAEIERANQHWRAALGDRT